MFHPSHLKDSHRSLPALFDFVRLPNSPVEVSLRQSPMKPADNSTTPVPYSRFFFILPRLLAIITFSYVAGLIVRDKVKRFGVRTLGNPMFHGSWERLFQYTVRN
jgi:hypothetical protein